MSLKISLKTAFSFTAASDNVPEEKPFYILKS